MNSAKKSRVSVSLHDGALAGVVQEQLTSLRRWRRSGGSSPGEAEACPAGDRGGRRQTV